MNFTANCVGGASRAQAITVLVAVAVFEVVSVRWDTCMALCADPEEAHGVEFWVVRDEGEGWKRLVLSESHIILKNTLLRPVVGRLSWDAKWLRWMSLCQTALAKGLRNLQMPSFCFGGFYVLLGTSSSSSSISFILKSDWGPDP